MTFTFERQRATAPCQNEILPTRLNTHIIRR